MSSDPISIRAAKELIEQISASLSMHKTTTDRALQNIAAALLKTEIGAFEIADTLGVSRPSVERWARGKNLPRSSDFRFWAVGELLEFVNRKAGAHQDVVVGTAQVIPFRPSISGGRAAPENKYKPGGGAGSLDP